MSQAANFAEEFLTPKGTSSYRDSIAKMVEALLDAFPTHPYSGKSPAELAAVLGGNVLPQRGSPIDEVLGKVRTIIAHSVALTHPNTVAHLHCPPLIASLAAEVVISALNQSMDSFDQSPAATMLELAVTRWLCEEAGLASGSDAIFTAGGTQSNFMALLLARDACISSHWNRQVQRDGLPADASRLRFLCSEVAHFTVEKSAYQLGLGTGAVIRVPVDEAFRVIPKALKESLTQLQERGLIPAAIVATAGTTDFGSIDPLPEISALAKQAGAWFHVDAAYGSALLLSDRHRERLRGLERADSIGMDFHKEFWQCISCAALLVRDAGQLRHLEIHADYLNPESDEEAGVPNLVNKSLATTRRFDALKLWFSFQVLGREKFGKMVDRTIELAAHAASFIRRSPALELVHKPEYGCVVFRYRSGFEVDDDRLNATLRQRLLERGVAVVGHTRVRGRQCLKLTCMNPTTSEEEIEALLQLIVEQGRQLET
ncbi:MAG: aspartate aminotransferase family protein [Terriglobales bacterium]